MSSDPPARGSAAELYTFGAQLQAALRGLVLTGVSLPTPFERVLKLAFAQRPGEPAACQLVYECMARYSNLLLVGPDDIVLAAAHQVLQGAGRAAVVVGPMPVVLWAGISDSTSMFYRCLLFWWGLMLPALQVGQRMSSVRHVQVGGRWEPPPPASGLDPDSCASLEEWREVLCRLAEAAPADRRPTLVQVAVRGFRGVSPQLARDIAQAAGVPADSLPADLAPDQWQRLHQQWQAWLQRLASGSFAASSCPRSGAYSLLGTQPRPVPSLLPFLHDYYSAPQQAETFTALKQQLARAVAAAMARLQKKMESLRQQGGDGDKHERTQRLADMVMGNIYR